MNFIDGKMRKGWNYKDFRKLPLMGNNMREMLQLSKIFNIKAQKNMDH